MGEDRLNKFIKDKVQDHQTPMDIDSFWQDIQTEQKREEKPKRRFFWWFFFGGLVLIAGLLIPILSDNENAKLEMAQTPLVKSESSISAAGGKIDRASISSKATTLEEENSVQKVEVTTTKPSAIKTMKSATDSSKLAKDNESFTKKQLPNSEDNNALNISSKQLIIPLHTTIVENNALSNLVTDNPNFTLKDQARSSNNKDLTVSNLKQEELGKTKPNLNQNRAIATLQQKWLLLRLNESTPKQQLDETNLYEPMIIDEKVAKWSMGAHFGYGLAQRKLNGNATYINTRNQLETPEQVLSAGLDIQYQFMSGLYFKSGVIYEQINERFDLDRTTDFEDFFNEDATNIIYLMSNGSTNTEKGTNSIRQQIQFRKVYNRYRSIDLPLTIGYTPVSDKKWKWFAEAGVLLNLVFLPEGQILGANNETFIELEDSDIFKSRTGVSLNIGVGLSYKLTKELSLWVSPHFRYALASMTTEDYELEQSFGRVALEVGLRKNW